ncbi:vanadium-dependent haloperoxidase [Streptomyces phaeochromogenes]|uniref:vanadium-dependent haloperoxidase n=1 Tax=Streptomyces phaeochromogenes TaxID=1923 RepID=UPI0038647F5A|nr:vanadium-dependent haloperoxidase [Streptomyces phaeochromogenes]WTA04157.1 vanadium-dependent haloperoxidase [Streptomyces phaeochromogenes]
MQAPPPSRTVRRSLVVGLTALALGALPWAPTAATASPDRAPARVPGAEVITDWSETAAAVVSVDAGRPTAEPFLWYGFVSAAVYNAVVGIEGRYTPYKWHQRGPRAASSEAAAAAAARRVLLTYFPASKARIDTAYTASLARIPDGKAEDRGVRFGERAAARIVELRENDGRENPVTYDKEPAPGVWRPTPPGFRPFVNPWLGKLRPMLFDSPDRFMPGPPPALTSKRYARDFAEVKSMGARNSPGRTARQTETARFFSDPLPQQLQAAYRDHTARHGLDIVEAARLFAAANTASADATITTWNSKFTHALWRPITAIRLAETDGNPATEADPSWEPLLNTPPYPEFIGGHCANDGAVMAVLDRLTGGDIDLRVSSAVTGTTRTYTRSADYNRDVINARIWGGIHFRTADVVGNRIGRHIGNWALDRYFTPMP